MEKRVHRLPYVIGCFFCLVFCLFLGAVHVSAAGEPLTVQVTASTTLSAGLRIYEENGTDEIETTYIDETTRSITVAPGTFRYTTGNGATGYFTVDDHTETVNLVSVYFGNVMPGYTTPDDYSLQLFDEEGREFGHAQDPDAEEIQNVCSFYVPQRNGDSYYTFRFTPTDASYQTVEGHFYVYRNTNFSSLNLSDQGRIPYIRKSEITVKAPVGMEIYTTWQLKLYTARNWQSYEPFKTEDGYNYFTVPEGYTYMLRQEGKVTRYCKELIGDWNEDGTEVTLEELKDDPTQVNRDLETGYYASMMTNLPYSSEIELNVGEYFDLVPLRGWQAISNSSDNEYVDPEWHYTVIGGDTSVASVEITEDDAIGQYGRIHANGTGTVLVAFWYDAMEAPCAMSATAQTDDGLHLYSALWPELTGIAVVNVSDGTGTQTEITTNIDMTEGRTVYYNRSQTDAKGVTVDLEDHAEYTFTPTAATDGAETPITSVRVHSPIMAEGGELSANPSDWLTDGEWTSYAANEDGSYTLNLEEGRNVVEIKAGDAVVYHVILARGLDITVSNAYNPGQTLVPGDTAQITIEGLVPPMFKMGAIYNPSGVTYSCKANGVDFTKGFGQYMAGSSFELKLTEEDVGTYTISDGSLSVAAWGAQNESHRNLTRNSMSGYWSGGDNPEIDYGVMARMPDITFTVENSEDEEEIALRDAGTLQALYVRLGRGESDVGSASNVDWYTSSGKISQNANYMVTPTTLRNNDIHVGAVLQQEDPDARLLVRYWYGDDVSEAVVRELDFSEIVQTESAIAGDPMVDTITTTYLVAGSTITKTAPLKVEMIVIPGEGTPTTYFRQLYHAQGRNNAVFTLNDLRIQAAEGSGSLGRWDGILEADDITYTDGEGQDVTQDLGYGFLGSEEHYTASVPYGTDRITLNGTYPAAITGISVTVNGGEETYGDGEAIPLEPGVNMLTVSTIVTQGKVATYTIDVTRRSEPTQVTFVLPEGADVAVLRSGSTVSAEADGTYRLESGEYTYYISRPGYLAKEGTLELDGTETERTVTVTDSDLEPVPAQSGTVTVRIAGQDTVLCSSLGVDITDDAELLDLASSRYVQYNHGGYTALHALIDACELGRTDIGFNCYKGVLTPESAITTGGLGPDAGWVCEVNGVVCEDPANTLVYGGDRVEYYYNSDRENMQHAWFEPETAAIEKGEGVTLTLMGTPVRNDGTAASPISGADVYLGGRLIGQTGENGAVTISGDAFTHLGENRVTAVKNNGDGRNTLTAVLSTVTVEKAANPDPDPDATTVTFRLIGDNKHGSGSDGHAYTTWLATQTYTFDRSAYEYVTVGDVFRTALGEAGLSYDGLEANYVRSITAPASCGGESLAEFDNGQNSGWMYTVNGYHPSVGVLDCEVTSGDEIIFHYVDDYALEVSDWAGGSSGNASTWDKWLEAEDETPGARANAAEAEALINAIGEVTLESQGSIQNARNAYDALSREEKSYVTNYLTLTNAESRLNELLQEQADQAAAAAVTEQIAALPSVEELTLSDAETVTAARNAYTALTEAQKSYVTEDTLQVLAAAEARIAELQMEYAAEIVEEEIRNLPAVEDLTLDHKAAVEAAAAHYEALTEEQKSVISAESLEKLQAAQARIAELQAVADDQAAAQKVADQIAALPSADEIVFAQKPVVEAAREAYNGLTEAQKAYVPEESLLTLQALEQKLADLQAQVDEVQALIEQLPDTEELTLADREAVDAAQAAYNALSLDQRQQLPEGLSDKLLAAQNRLTQLQTDTEAAEKVAAQIGLLPNTDALTLEDEPAVSAAREAYEALSEEQKALVAEELLHSLEEKEARIEELKAQQPDPDDPTVTPTPTPGTDPDDPTVTPTPTPGTDPDDPAVTPTPTPGDGTGETVTLTYQNYPISVTGEHLSGYELRLEALTASDSDVKLMQQQISSDKALIRLYDVKLYKDGQEAEPEGTLTLNIQVGSKYNGKTLEILHVADGKVETLSGTVTDGVLHVTTDTLGKFGVAVDASTVTTGGSGNGATGNAGGSGSGNGSGTVSGTGSVRTGDSTDYTPYVAALVLAACGGCVLVVFLKKKSANR